MLSRLYKSAIYSNAIVEADGKTAPTKHECTSVQSLKKESPNLGILARSKKTHLQQIPNPPPNLLPLEKNHLHARNVTCAYHCPNLRWKDAGKK